MFICVEGCDAAGKATQVKLLFERIIRMDREVMLYSFPRYDTEVGKALLRHLKGETRLTEFSTEAALAGHLVPIRRAPEDALWFQALNLADKAEVAGDIRGHLMRGRFVVCDRWTPSAVAFGVSDGLDRQWLERVQEPLPQADIYILIDVSEEEALRRRPVLRDRYEKDREKQKTVREEYARLWAEKSADVTNSKLWMKIDGEGTVKEVHARIWNVIAGAHEAMG